jgi:hypothetical protein
MPRKRYVELDHVLCHLKERRVVLEDRPTRYKFGTRNYGEVSDNWYNRADGDKWDVFAPGYENALPTGRAYRVAGVMGVLLLANGNHKIAVRLHSPGYDPQRARREVADYVRRYTAGVGVRGEWWPVTSV